MRKFITLSTALAYAAIFNYCLVYAAVTGEGHHPTATSAAGHGEHDSHGHGHDGDSHDHAPGGEEDACCTTFTENLPVLAPAPRAALVPAISAAFIAVALDAPFFIVTPEQRLIARAQGPPGPPGRSSFLPPSSPRAPPVLPGF